MKSVTVTKFVSGLFSSASSRQPPPPPTYQYPCFTYRAVTTAGRMYNLGANNLLPLQSTFISILYNGLLQ